ncbi:MAG: ABC transporter ATP-binding protein, partial [Gemmatimonadetes bacterium]|nr:ABC transporter ATP-binding protein [Gemmatimonadota bacterium]NIQ52016.1 ABC transporter ATP-binding protein [Gemmatimonadota bacterium]NIU72116.1 ABC transporter ATP-binding protein [Gammaproteobacteria bacterium]NIX42679.1 ABC transporter ATP-binding protein [Gemmatimonadota bacterium]NIY06840.1 ABC transporter ATP-binding protein [Gemmatimonadota bacterium]
MSVAALVEVRDMTTTRAGVGPGVLSGVSLGVRGGERVVVTGPSGSG